VGFGVKRTDWVVQFTDGLWKLMGKAGEGLLIGDWDGALMFGEFVVAIATPKRQAEQIEIIVSRQKERDGRGTVEGGVFRPTTSDDPYASAQRVIDLLIAQTAAIS
jgi:hypothetical protein